MLAIEINNVSCTYGGKLFVLRDVNLNLREREVVALVGPSGVGKSTLLRCVNRLVRPEQGDIKVFGKSVMAADRDELRKIRIKIGVIFQQFNLFERQKVIENVLLGRLGYINTWRGLLFFPKLVYSETDYGMAKEVLKEVGLEEFAFKRVFNLSGGQKQRVAIARALVQQPKIILADEPVSNLDSYLAKDIMDILTSIADKRKITILVSLHSLDLAKHYADRVVGLARGRVIYDGSPRKINQQIISKIYGRKI